MNHFAYTGYDKKGIIKIPTVPMPSALEFQNALHEEINSFEIEGYNPTDIMFWEPMYVYWKRIMAEYLSVITPIDPLNFDFADYIKKTYDLDVHVIKMDHREEQIFVMFYIYCDKLKERKK